MWFFQAFCRLRAEAADPKSLQDRWSPFWFPPDFSSYSPFPICAATLHKKLGANVFCEVPHLLGLCSGCVKSFLPALQLSSVFFYRYPVTVFITYHPCQIAAAFLWPLPVLLLAVCLHISSTLNSTRKWLSLFFFFSVSGLFSATASKAWLLDCNPPPSTPSSSVDAFLASHLVLGKQHRCGPALAGKDLFQTVLFLLSVPPLFILPSLFALALFHFWYPRQDIWCSNLPC